MEFFHFDTHASCGRQNTGLCFLLSRETESNEKLSTDSLEHSHWVSAAALTVLHQSQSAHPPSSGPATGLFFLLVLTVSIRASWRQKAVISHHRTGVHSWFSIMPVCQCCIFSHTQNSYENTFLLTATYPCYGR